MNIKIMIGGVDYSRCLVLPIKYNSLLDERLDEARVSLRGTTINLFDIGSTAIITVDGKELDFIVSADESTELPVGSKTYNHELSLIEPTKILEGIVVENLTFQNTRSRIYKDVSQETVDPVIEENSQYIQKVISPFSTPVVINNTIELPPINQVVIKKSNNMLTTYSYITPRPDEEQPGIYIIDPDGNKIEIVDGYSSVGSNYKTGGKYTVEKVGDFSVVYHGKISRGYNGSIGAIEDFKVMFNITATDIIYYPELRAWNITTVIDRVLNLCEPHLSSKSPRFVFDEQQSERFASIAAPEFTFTSLTLKEILDQIGGFIHGVPRLVRDAAGEFTVIRFDMLGETIESDIKDEPYVSQTLSQNIESYATELDSVAENFVNTKDRNSASITDPYENGSVSLRTEEQYVRITDENGVISTTYPIYTIQRLEAASGGTFVDITPYVYESTQYSQLSSYSSEYPSSKAYALYYTIGSKDIKGLWSKTPNAISNALSDYAINNIIEQAGGEVDKNAYPKLKFRVTYTPIFSARVKQHKYNIDKSKKNAIERTLSYSQGANMIEATYYGENLRGTIARMGNGELCRTYRFNSIDKLPNIGEYIMFDNSDCYISAVTAAIYSGCIECTVLFSKDYNRLSQYIGINSQWRAFEVSERNVFNRDYVYTDYAIVVNPKSDITEISEAGALISAEGIKRIGNSIMWQYPTSPPPIQKPITVATITTVDLSDKQYSITLPVVSSAFGYALSFSFYFANNYSAGPQSRYVSGDNEVSGYWQTDVPYSDYYGRFKQLRFKLTDKLRGTNSDAPFDLPAGNYMGEDDTVLFETPENDGLEIDKNGGEAIRMNYQLQFVAQRTNPSDVEYILGTALTRHCSLISLEALTGVALYVIDHRIGKFDNTFNRNDATRISTILGYEYNAENNMIELGFRTSKENFFKSIQANAKGKAWALAVVRQLGTEILDGDPEILIAQNGDIEETTSITLPDIYFRHSI